MTSIRILDCETTIFEKGNPFSRRNKLCYVGIASDDTYRDYDIEYSNSPYGSQLQDIKESLESADLVVGFNLKFDLHWIQRYVPDLVFSFRVWDCQLAHFILSNQKQAYPSLDEVLAANLLPPKLDTVKLEYWDNGIDTPGVPEPLLQEYLALDVTRTKQVYEAQLQQFNEGDPALFALFRLQCVDLLTLLEMEHEGMVYNVERSRELAIDVENRIADIDRDLNALVVEPVNWNSPEHLSATLYGGVLRVDVRVPTERVLKDGTIKRGEKWGVKTYDMPRLVKPVKGSETSKNGVWSVAEPILRSLKVPSGRASKVITAVLMRSELRKLLTTYYDGLPELLNKKDWEPGIIHGQFNQCVAATGRLSSSAPNLQNFAAVIKELFRSRYASS